jgi:hypothetical protein
MHDVRVSIEVLDVKERMTYLFGEEQSKMTMLLKGGEPISHNDGVWESSSFTSFPYDTVSELIHNKILQFFHIIFYFHINSYLASISLTS